MPRLFACANPWFSQPDQPYRGKPIRDDLPCVVVRVVDDDHIDTAITGVAKHALETRPEPAVTVVSHEDDCEIVHRLTACLVLRAPLKRGDHEPAIALR
jgi:hypothetical protein